MNPTWPILRVCISDLRTARGELAEVENRVREQRAQAILASQAESVSGRKEDADLATPDLSADVTNLRCQIAQGEDLRAFLVMAIEHDVDVTTLGVT